MMKSCINVSILKSSIYDIYDSVSSIVSDIKLPAVGTISSRPSLLSREMRLVLPAPVSPIHTTSYSGLGDGGPLQHSFRKH